jgi:hypothetical protein
MVGSSSAAIHTARVARAFGLLGLPGDRVTGGLNGPPTRWAAIGITT